MSNTINIGVLVAARDEYFEILKSNLAPLIIQGFNSIYTDALRLTRGKQTLRKFQELLREILGWNQTILSKECKRIKNKFPQMMDCLTAILVSCVKILSSVRLNNNDSDIQLKICTPDIFVHAIYIECGKQFWYNPWLFYHETTKYGSLQKRKFDILQIVREAIDESIRKLIPLDSIIKEYLTEALNSKTDTVQDPQVDQEDVEVAEEDIEQDDEIEEEDDDDDDEGEIDEDEDDDEPKQNVNVNPFEGGEEIKSVTVPTDGKNSRLFSMGDKPVNNNSPYSQDKPMFIDQNENSDNEDGDDDEDEDDGEGGDEENDTPTQPPPQTNNFTPQVVTPQTHLPHPASLIPAHPPQPVPQPPPMAPQPPPPMVTQPPPQPPQGGNGGGGYSFFE